MQKGITVMKRTTKVALLLLITVLLGMQLLACEQPETPQGETPPATPPSSRVEPDIEKKDYTKCLKNDVKGLKIGVPKEFFAEGINEEVKKSLEESPIIKKGDYNYFVNSISG